MKAELTLKILQHPNNREAQLRNTEVSLPRKAEHTSPRSWHLHPIKKGFGNVFGFVFPLKNNNWK